FADLLQDQIRPERLTFFELLDAWKALRPKLAEATRVVAALRHDGVGQCVDHFFGGAELDRLFRARALGCGSTDLLRIDTEQVATELLQFVELVKPFELGPQIFESHSAREAYPLMGRIACRLAAVTRAIRIHRTGGPEV